MKKFKLKFRRGVDGGGKRYIIFDLINDEGTEHFFLHFENIIILDTYDDCENKFNIDIQKKEIKDQLEYKIIAMSKEGNKIYEKIFYVKNDEITYILPTITRLSNKEQIKLLEEVKEITEEEIVKEFVDGEIEYIEIFEDEE